jgi:flagellar protein FlaJ
MIDKLKTNIDSALRMANEMKIYQQKLNQSAPEEKTLIEESIDSLFTSIKLINKSIPSILQEISTARPLKMQSVRETVLEDINFNMAESKVNVTVDRKDKDRLISELSVNEDLMNRLKKTKSLITDKKDSEFKASRGYLRIANKFFLDSASESIEKGNFKNLTNEIKKANIDMLSEAYVAMIYFSTFLSFFLGLAIAAVLLFVEFGSGSMGISWYYGAYLPRVLHVFWIPFVLPPIVFLMLLFYPSAEKKSLSKHIEQELPFAVINMSAISGSGIEPTEIFKIISQSDEYPYLRKEIRKVINQVNIYGYDLLTALNNVAQSTPSERLSELFIGLSTTIHSGGNLSDFFEKRSGTLLTSYRIDREKFTKIAETFMDIYISVVIASPMILILLLIMISVSGVQMGFSPNQMTIAIILLVSIINIVFLGVLQIKQPVY